MSISFEWFIAGIGAILGFFISIYLRREGSAKRRIFRALEDLAAEQKRHSDAIVRIETQLKYINGHKK